LLPIIREAFVWPFEFELTIFQTVTQPFSYFFEISPKSETQNPKLKNEVILEFFNSQKRKRKKIVYLIFSVKPRIW
jgi:hypothetical protein